MAGGAKFIQGCPFGVFCFYGRRMLSQGAVWTNAMTRDDYSWLRRIYYKSTLNCYCIYPRLLYFWGLLVNSCYSQKAGLESCWPGRPPSTPLLRVGVDGSLKTFKESMNFHKKKLFTSATSLFVFYLALSLPLLFNFKLISPLNWNSKNRPF